MSDFASRARELRTTNGLTLQNIGDLLGYTRQAPSTWEQGEREPKYDDLIKLADHYGVTIDYLLGRPGAQRDSDAVKKAKSALQQYLELREPDLTGTTAASRMGVVFRFLSETAPMYFSRGRVASWLRMSAPALDRLLADESEATDAVVLRFSELTGVPEAWFWMPDPRHYRNRAEAWESLTRTARQAHLSPGEAVALLEKAAKEARASR